MCLSPTCDYETKETVQPNTGRSFWLFEEIQRRFLLAVSEERYISGCQILAHAGARVLQRCGVPARPKLTLQPEGGIKNGYKGHVVVDQEGLLLDFKAAMYTNDKGEVAAIRYSLLQEQGWVPPKKQLVDVTPRTLREMNPFQRDNLNTLAGTTEELLNRDAYFFVRDFNLCVNSCSDLFE
jgi:hypothetical protein